MNPFQSFYNMKIGVVDLSASSAEVFPLDEGWIYKHLGGAAMNAVIHSQYQGEPIVFGTGPLTGSFAPASSLMVASLKSSIFKRLCHVPLMLRTGPDMKFSGVDYLVVKGTAPEQSLLHVNHGKIQILSARNIEERTVPEAIMELRKVSPSFQSLIINGPAADRGVPYASVSIGSSGSLDKVGLASLMASKKLKGIMFGGMDGLHFNRENPDQGKELEKRISAEKNFKNRGFASVLKKLDSGKDAIKYFKAVRKKDMACYHCPSPCMTHVVFSWQSPKGEETQSSDDGLLLLDHTGYLALAKKVRKNVLPLLRSCLRFGLDPVGVAEMLREGGILPEYLDVLNGIMMEDFPSTTVAPVAKEPLEECVPPIQTWDSWEERVALAMIIGVCPIFLLRFPQITDVTLLSFICMREEDLKTLRDGLLSAISSLTPA
jgi:aldehyde:ferredoxin oxidoreductase